MRAISRVSLIAAVSAALVGSIALPATAADTVGSPVTVEVPVGVLSVSVPASAALGTVTPGGFAEVTLTPVQVSDTRAGVAGWDAQVTMGDLVGTLNPARVIPASAATYTPGNANVVGTATVTPATLSGLSATPQPVQSATAVSGNNTATWSAVLRIDAPDGTLAENYTATLTHSVS
jgi:hypothetical protein